MNLYIKYNLGNVPAPAQFTSDAVASTGNAGINFIGSVVADYTLVRTNPTASNDSHKGSILPATNGLIVESYVDKMIGLVLPELSATTMTIFTIPLVDLGINGIVKGINILGISRTVAGITTFAYSSGLNDIKRSSDSTGMFRLEIPADLNEIGGAELVLEIRSTK
jgi:hypothetical protein